MATAWAFQDPKQLKKHGTERAGWYVGFIDPDGRKRCQSCGRGASGQAEAERRAAIIGEQLSRGTFDAPGRQSWDRFRREYESKILPQLEYGTQCRCREALDHFERLVGPKKLSAIRTQVIDDFIAARRQEPGKKKGTTLSAASVNHDLRHLKAALNVAVEWGYLTKLPMIRMLRELKKEKRYVTPEHFAAMYSACDAARMPKKLPYPPGDWWRAILTFCYMTGWRIGEVLSLTRDDVDMEAGTAITLAEENKGGRDDRVPLHPAVLDHLRTIPGFSREVFPWPHSRRPLDTELQRIQVAAGINLPCRGKHEHSRSCHLYSWHAFRRAYATENADRLSGPTLQAMMRHKSFATTRIYIETANKLKQATEQQFVPEVLRRKTS